MIKNNNKILDNLKNEKIFISHRGNLNGKNINLENSPEYINNALKEGYDVEIDVWFEEKVFFLGHDKPVYPINKSFLSNRKLWCHCKNIEALIELKKLNSTHCGEFHYFWHENDKVTITSKGYIWAYPGNDVEGSIAVMPEINNDDTSNRLGICSDYIVKYKDIIKI